MEQLRLSPVEQEQDSRLDVQVCFIRMKEAKLV